MGALLGTNDSKNVVIAITPPTGPAGVALGALVLALLPGELGITFPFTVTGKMSGQFASAQRSVAQTAYTAGADGKVKLWRLNDRRRPRISSGSWRPPRGARCSCGARS